MKKEQAILDKLIPDYYQNNMEMNTLVRVENGLFENLKNEIQHVQDNQYILTCDENTLIHFEDILKIKGNFQVETLDFRRLRIINRINTRPPFTLDFLMLKLDEIYGRENYQVFVDYSNYTLYIESSHSTAEWYKETKFTVNRVKPANIRYVHVPVLIDWLMIIEQLSYQKMEFAKVGYTQIGITQLEKRGVTVEVEIL
ncbi:putative phage tail protein [Carnobacterium maltaromaticum]|uniref:putative phage tail protein n=1 Tax=Carnobacterium maltaromaticum TaxID=2751 RepID=UPI00026C85EB|nr:putative phage tail protein [Carnobacterium maltaromaticum]